MESRVDWDGCKYVPLAERYVAAPRERPMPWLIEPPWSPTAHSALNDHSTYLSAKGTYAKYVPLAERYVAAPRDRPVPWLIEPPWPPTTSLALNANSTYLPAEGTYKTTVHQTTQSSSV